MKLATTTGDFNTWTNCKEDAMTYIQQSGFRYLDYDFGNDYRNRNGVYSADWEDYLVRIQKKAEELSVHFVQSHAPMGRPIERGENHKPFVEDTIRCIEACGRLGIPTLVVHSGYEMGISKEECFERNKLFYEELLPTAEQNNVNILVENFNKMCIEGMYWIDNAADLRAMVDYVDHPLFHACWDAGHGNMQETSQDEALRILGKHVYALHVQDNYGNDDAHLAPFFGTLNLDSLIHGLMDIDYKGYFTFEAGNILLPHTRRRPFEQDMRLLQAPLSLKIKAEQLLYEIGKCALSAYGLYEE